MNRYLSMVLVVVFLWTFGVGCSGEYTVRRVGPGRYVVSLVPDGGSSPDGQVGQGGPSSSGPVTDEPVGQGVVQDEPPSPPPPENESPPPSGTGTPAQVPSTSQEKVDELKNTYGIEITGYPTARDIDNLLVAARQYRPEETSSVTIFYDRTNRTSGVMGYYQPSGNMHIYDHYKLHTVFHELTHHITLYPRNSRARKIAEEVARKTPPEQGSLRDTPAQYIPRGYARKNTAEYWAEFFTYLREKERGLRGGYPCSPYFNPPESIRKLARQIYAD